MALSINTNTGALGIDRQINKTNSFLSQTLRQLASGKRINRAADDAAGLAIAEAFESSVRQANVESRNLQYGYNAAQTAEGGLSAQQDMVQRVRELSLQASNGTLNDGQRAAINAEAQQLIDQINDTASSTQYNGQNLIDQDQTVDLGTEGSNELVLQESTAASLGLDSLDLSTQAGAAAALESTDAALGAIGENRANIGAQMNRYESAINQREIQAENDLASQSAIRDADIARLSMQQAQAQIQLQGGTAALVQSNVASQTALSLLS